MALPKIPTQNTGICTIGAAGVALMVLHLIGYITGWAWPIMYVILIVSANDQEMRN